MSRQRRSKRNRVAFKEVIRSRREASPGSRQIYRELRLAFKNIPTIYKARAFADNPDFLRLAHESTLQWPSSTSLDDKIKELIGLAKSIAHRWEPGVLTNIEGAIEAGASEKEIVEAILVTSSVLALADLDFALKTADDQMQHDTIETSREIEEAFNGSEAKFGRKPQCYNTRIAKDNPDWLKRVQDFSEARYSEGALDAKSKALICLAASIVKHWDDGVREHVQYALQSGATKKQIADVMFSTYKTAGVIGIQMGLGVPCSVPQMPGLHLIADYYRNKSSKVPSKRV